MADTPFLIDEYQPPLRDKTRPPSPFFQRFAHSYLNAGYGGLIVRVDQLQAQALDILIVGGRTVTVSKSSRRKRSHLGAVTFQNQFRPFLAYGLPVRSSQART